jgi:hypothetical protein
MRTLLLIVAGLLICGCAGTRDGQNAGGPSHTTPVVFEPPSISARLRYERQQQAEQVSAADTEVQGALKQ